MREQEIDKVRREEREKYKIELENEMRRRDNQREIQRQIDKQLNERKIRQRDNYIEKRYIDQKKNEEDYEVEAEIDKEEDIMIMIIVKVQHLMELTDRVGRVEEVLEAQTQPLLSDIDNKVSVILAEVYAPHKYYN
ncbi:MAG: hypothetical protein EZS28_023482 [Streblomastix strix]|uniref:Uncharacterized protein n=1 Tax=Streblomastix strix TaxID=222440 RepID=A0A5J4VEQ0_9EUKA|nr:MAG: hypothetical protein EZS28_023481 [Streblomastix strix]KAA6380992.1 MAG: hypothetical protein EZS28_023482 [Streblomastix strix]